MRFIRTMKRNTGNREKMWAGQTAPFFVFFWFGCHFIFELCVVSPVGAGLPAMAASGPTNLLLVVYISIPAVTAAYAFALTASHLEEPQVTKGSCPFRSVPR